jgi:hypothetical protein
MLVFQVRQIEREVGFAEPTPLEGPASEDICYFAKGTKLLDLPEKLALDAIYWGECNGKKFESVLNESDVTVWVIMIFPKGLTCELVVWKEGRSTEPLGAQLLGIEFVDDPFLCCDVDKSAWIWARFYSEKDKLIAEGGLRIRTRLFSEEALKCDAESATGVLAALGLNAGEAADTSRLGMSEPATSNSGVLVEPVSTPAVEDEISLSDMTEPTTSKTELALLGDENGAVQATSVLAAEERQESPDKTVIMRPPLVVIGRQELGGKRVVVNGVKSYEYFITRDKCLEVIEILMFGESVKLFDVVKGDNINVQSRFQHDNKRLSKDDHFRFFKSHIVSVGLGHWKIVAEKP